MFFKKNAPSLPRGERNPSFAYLASDICYVDSACQTMRPQWVIDAEMEYYLHTNACGGRVKYQWGIDVDRKVQETRSLLLHMSGKSASEYVVAFTLNTTYGINLVLHQLHPSQFDSIVTSDIEHNSVFLPTMTWAEKNKKKRIVLSREEDGKIIYNKADLQRSVVLVNTMSNIDGRMPENLHECERDIHASGGILLLDAAQGFAHDARRLKDINFDAVFGSGHKMYGPSIGFIILKRSLLHSLNPFFIGGGTVTDVTRDTYELLRTGEEAYSILEPGLQNWAGIIGLNAAIKWLQDFPKKEEYEARLASELYAGVANLPHISLLNTKASPIISFHTEGLDAHRLALYLDQQKILCRSGYFCCHSYLLHQRKLPPLLRISLGLHNTSEDINHLCTVLQKILSSL
jgi:cysteine desulfurase/selenocysteine lyase